MKSDGTKNSSKGAKGPNLLEKSMGHTCYLVTSSILEKIAIYERDLQQRTYKIGSRCSKSSNLVLIRINRSLISFGSLKRAQIAQNAVLHLVAFSFSLKHSNEAIQL